MRDESGRELHAGVGRATSSTSRGGLQRRLLSWFLLAAIVPLGIVSFVTYVTARDSLRQSIHDSLSSVVAGEAAFLDSWVARQRVDLESQAASTANAHFLIALREGHTESGQELSEFPKSFEWAQIVNDRAGDLKTFRSLHGLYDVFLIDSEGNILFSVAEGEDLGTNLFVGAASKTRFAGACQRTLATGRPAFSDLEYYEPSDSMIAGFFAEVIVDEFGDKIGVFAYQLRPEPVGRTLRSGSGLEPTIEAYVIGKSSTGGSVSLRSDLAGTGAGMSTGDALFLDHEIGTEQAQLWLDVQGIQSLVPVGVEGGDGLIRAYDGPHGERVLGMHRTISIMDVDWAVVAEIREVDAFASVRSLQALATALLLVTTLIVVLIATFTTRKIVHPIAELSLCAREVAGGDLSQRVEARGRTEITDLQHGFNSMVDGLRQAARLQEYQNWFETGQAGLSSEIRGDIELEWLATVTVKFLCEYLEVQLGAFYAIDENEVFKLVGSYAFRCPDEFANQFELGEGFVGQVAKDRKHILLTEVPEGYVAMHSGLGGASPQNILIWPVAGDEETLAVIELGSLRTIPDRCIEFLESVTKSLTVAVSAANSRKAQERLLEETHRAAAALAQSEEQTRSILETAAEGIMVIDEGGTVELYNPAAEAIFGYSPAEVIGQNIKMLLPAPYAEEHDGYLATYLRTGKKHIIGSTRELAGLRKDGEIFPLDLSVSETIAGGVRKFTGLVRDITERKDAEMLVSQKNERLAEKTDELKASEQSLQQLLEESQAQSEELQVQTDLLQQHQKELKGANEELAEKTANLQASEESLQAQSEELLATNKDLEQKTDFLKMQKIVIEEAKEEVEKQAQQAVLASKYKSEFLANMSHELRTPLNSLLILSKSLSQNGEGNLSGDQVKAAEVIHSGGAELLFLINDILDLSKIEAGKVEAVFEPVRLGDLLGALENQFRPMANERGLDLQLELAPGVPELLTTDEQKLAQVLRNLLSNALKFTKHGSVNLKVSRPTKSIEFSSGATVPKEILAFSVSDTGIGIPENVRASIFESFQQADGSTAREFGGTGLGLTISREFARLLGGDLQVRSTLGQGSVFTMYLPLEAEVKGSGATPKLESEVTRDTRARSLEGSAASLETPSEDASGAEASVLVIDSDSDGASKLMDLCRKKGFKGLAASMGESGLKMASTLSPTALLLDLDLPDIDVLEMLERLRELSDLRSQPLAVLAHTSRELGNAERAALQQLGCSLVLRGPEATTRLADKVTLFLHSVDAALPERQRVVVRSTPARGEQLNGKRVLIVDDDMRNTFALSMTLEDAGMVVTLAENGQRALDALAGGTDFDLILMDIMMPVMDGYEAMREIRKDSQLADLPIIALTAKAMPGDRSKCLDAGANDYLTKPVDVDRLLSLIRVWIFDK